ncbi:hypothetical protein D039_4636A, partial [Vibrio parahaemolyticus EKP-028]
MVTYGST